MTLRNMLEENQKAIIEEYRSGASCGELGRKYGVNCGYIWTMLKEWGEPIRQTKKREANRDTIVEMHLSGKLPHEIAKVTGASAQTVRRAIVSSGYDISHRNPRKELCLNDHQDEMTQMYVNMVGTKAIAKHFGCKERAVVECMHRWGVRVRSLREYARPVNEHFFDCIDTQEKAYILGFFMADGCNQTKAGTVGISITDEDILREMARVMEYDGKITIVEPRRSKDGASWTKPQYQMRFGSRLMSDALVRVGCINRKTYHATFQNDEQVPPHLHRHLIRGWNDGDGTITAYNPKVGRRKWSTRIVGTEASCRGISDCVMKNLGFPGYVSPVHKGAKHVTWCFALTRLHQVRAYLDWLYEGSTIHMERKREKYAQFLGEYENLLKR